MIPIKVKPSHLAVEAIQTIQRSLLLACVSLL